MKLYELKTGYAELLGKLYDEDLSEEALFDTLESIEDAIDDKIESYAIIIQQLEEDCRRIKEEELRLASRRRGLESKIGWLKTNAYDGMKAVGKTKIQTPLFTISIQKNGGKRSLVLDVDASELPAEYQKITVGANNDKLRELLGDKESCDYCHLAEQGESLRIR